MIGEVNLSQLDDGSKPTEFIVVINPMHLERPKLHTILAFLNAKGLNIYTYAESDISFVHFIKN